jgi:hypothetical protein
MPGMDTATEANVHGPITCRVCFEDRGPAVTSTERGGFRLVNDPGYWGAPDPVVLVLGQSKGRTQWRAWGDEFDQVAFAGSRDRLQTILERIGVPLDHTDFDASFRPTEQDLGFASLVRCSLSRDDGSSSGSPVTAAMASPAADQWVRACIQRWLSRFNPRLRLVVLLGITDAYVEAVLDRLKTLHAGSFRRIDGTTAEAGGVLWTFAQHPSPLSMNHYRRWIGQAPSVKRDAASSAVQVALATTLIPASPSAHLGRPPSAEAVRSAPTGPIRVNSVRPSSAGRSATASAIWKLLGDDPGLVRRGALSVDNKKMSDWRAPGGAVFAFEHQYGYLWVHDGDAARELLKEITGTIYPKRDLWRVGTDGRERYGRHSALRTVPELRDADLIRFAPQSVAEARRILTCLRAP